MGPERILLTPTPRLHECQRSTCNNVVFELGLKGSKYTGNGQDALMLVQVPANHNAGLASTRPVHVAITYHQRSIVFIYVYK